MEKIIIWDRRWDNCGMGDIRIWEESLYQCIRAISNISFMVYHLDASKLEKAEKEIGRNGHISYVLETCCNYLLANDLQEEVYDIYNYSAIEDEKKRYTTIENTYRVKQHTIVPVPFGEKKIPKTYTIPLHIYTTETYEDVLSYFQKRDLLYEEIIKECNAWSEEKQEMFKDIFFPGNENTLDYLLKTQKKKVKMKV